MLRSPECLLQPPETLVSKSKSSGSTSRGAGGDIKAPGSWDGAWAQQAETCLLDQRGYSRRQTTDGGQGTRAGGDSQGPSPQEAPFSVCPGDTGTQPRPQLTPGPCLCRVIGKVAPSPNVCAGETRRGVRVQTGEHLTGSCLAPWEGWPAFTPPALLCPGVTVSSSRA